MTTAAVLLSGALLGIVASVPVTYELTVRAGNAQLLSYSQRIIRVLDPNCHAEYPRSRTRRMISNVRITAVEGDLVTVSANFVCYRFRRYERIREYVGAYRYILRRAGDSFRIKERRVLIDAHELGTLGSVSFIL